MSTDRLDRISSALESAFTPCTVEVRDDSAAHAGHPGARDGRGHFAVTVVSDAFDGKPQLQRHRMVYAVLDDMLKSDIHALQIRALTTKETQ
jgi:BolA family transcriptional regulator, general stress-responsive regulator